MPIIKLLIITLAVLYVSLTIYVILHSESPLPSKVTKEYYHDKN